MFDTIKKRIADKFNGAVDVVEREFVPFDIRLGCRISFDTNVSMIYDALCPKPFSDTVISMGSFSMANSKVFRFYLDNAFFLQVICDDKNEIEECRLFHTHKTILPSTSKGWGEWIADGQGHIGAYDYTIDGREFIRMSSWADPEEHWVRPIDAHEQIKFITDQKDQYITHSMMGYGRWLNEENEVAEYLILSVDEDLTDGLVEEVKVVLNVGFDIHINEITVY